MLQNPGTAALSGGERGAAEQCGWWWSHRPFSAGRSEIRSPRAACRTSLVGTDLKQLEEL